MLAQASVGHVPEGFLVLGFNVADGRGRPLTAWLHATWFQDDGVHVTQLGAAKLGEFIHRALVRHAQP